MYNMESDSDDRQISVHLFSFKISKICQIYENIFGFCERNIYFYDKNLRYFHALLS